MAIHTDRRQTETDLSRATTRVLLLVEGRAAERSLADWLRRQDGYEPVAAGDQTGDRVDVTAFDQRGFERYDQHRRERAGEASVARPSLLVLPADDTSWSWEDIDTAFGGVVDDVLRVPIDEVDARATFERNCRLRREAERRAETSARLAQFERLVDAMDHALYITDTDGTIEFVNPAFTAMTGYDQAAVVGETPALLRSGYHDDEYYARLWATVSAGEVWEGLVVNERKNGERYHAEQTIVPVTGDDGTVERYVAVQTDITERRNKQKQLEVLDRILRHNLRNSMSVVQARARILEQSVDDDLRPHAAAVLSTSRDLVETVDTEREIVRLLTGARTQSEQDVSRLVRQTVDGVRAANPDATVVAEVPNGVHCSASPKLDRAVEELLVNAIAHNEAEQPSVSLSVTAHPEEVAIAVADDGPGIPASEAAILTEVDSLDPLFHGSGLGLWLVYWIVRFSQGTVTVTENEPRGSVVTLRLPTAGEGLPDPGAGCQ